MSLIAPLHEQVLDRCTSDQLPITRTQNNINEKFNMLRQAFKKRPHDNISLNIILPEDVNDSYSCELQKTLLNFIVNDNTIEREINLNYDEDTLIPDARIHEIPDLPTTLTSLDDQSPPQTLSNNVFSAEMTKVLVEPVLESQVLEEPVLESQDNLDDVDSAYLPVLKINDKQIDPKSDSNKKTKLFGTTNYDNMFKENDKITEEQALNSIKFCFNGDEIPDITQSLDAFNNLRSFRTFDDLHSLTNIIPSELNTITSEPMFVEVNEVLNPNDKREEYATVIFQKQVNNNKEHPLPPNRILSLIMGNLIQIPPPPPKKVMQYNTLTRENEMVFTEKLYLSNVPTKDINIIKNDFLIELSKKYVHNISVRKVEIVTDRVKSMFRQHAILTIAEENPTKTMVNLDKNLKTKNFPPMATSTFSDALKEFLKFGIFIGSSRCDIRSAKTYRFLRMILSPQLLRGDNSQIGLIEKLQQCGVTGIASISLGTTTAKISSGSVIVEFVDYEDAKNAMEHLQEFIKKYPKPLVKDVTWASYRQQPYSRLNISKQNMSTMLLKSPRSKKFKKASKEISRIESEIEILPPQPPLKEDLLHKQYTEIFSSLESTNYNLDLSSANLGINKAQLMTITTDLTRLGYSFNFPKEVSWVPGSDVFLSEDDKVLEGVREQLVAEKREKERLRISGKEPPKQKVFVIDSPKIETIRTERGFQPFKKSMKFSYRKKLEKPFYKDVIMRLPSKKQQYEREL